MLKIVHVLTGAIALVLSFVPSLTGGVPPLAQPEALCLLLLGLLNVQFAASTHAPGHQRVGPVLTGVSVLLLLAAVVQGIVLLIPTVTIAGLPLTLASLTLAIIAVLLHLAASTQSRTERPARHASTTNTTKPQRPRSTASPAAGREAGTVKWFNTSKGFGFISRDSGDDVFVHFRAIRGEGHRVLVEGQRVEFTIMMRDKGLQAEDVVPA